MPDEYISRRDARIAILEKQAGGGVDQKITVGTAEAVINAVPAADVAEVVRCRDCNAWKRNVGIADSPNGHCFEHDIDTNGQDFCSYGVKKGETPE